MTTAIRSLSTHEAKDIVAKMDFDDVGHSIMDFCMFMSVSVWAGYVDDKLACIWGIIPPTLMSNQAYLWLYTTDVIKEHQFLLVRHSQLVIEELLNDYESIVGHATIGSDKSIKWLKWLGAKFSEPQGTSVPFRISRHG